MDSGSDAPPTSELAEWSKRVHAETKQRIHFAMKQIETEIQNNHGIYPSRLSISEVCRRAGVARATLEKGTHKSSTLPLVAKWLGAIRKQQNKNDLGSASKLPKREETYKARWEAVCQKYHEMELEMVTLRDEVALLRSQLESVRKGERKIVALKSKV
jgi:hypothetical protein